MTYTSIALCVPTLMGGNDLFFFRFYLFIFCKLILNNKRWQNEALSKTSQQQCALCLYIDCLWNSIPKMR